VGRYRAWAAKHGLPSGPLPRLGELHRLADETLKGPAPLQNVSSVEPYREQVEKLRQENVEIAAIYDRLKERGYIGSYSSVHRFVRNLEPKTPEVTVRVETPPGEEVQVDSGYAGLMIDPETGELRRTWVFVMTLSWSRHQYTEFVFDQKVETCLRFPSFGEGMFASRSKLSTSPCATSLLSKTSNSALDHPSIRLSACARVIKCSSLPRNHSLR